MPTELDVIVSRAAIPRNELLGWTFAGARAAGHNHCLGRVENQFGGRASGNCQSAVKTVSLLGDAMARRLTEEVRARSGDGPSQFAAQDFA